jgi:peptidoglycan-associated lipoprotein
MKRSLVLFGLSLLILALGFMLVSGCSKKVVKEAGEEKTAAVQKESAAQPAASAETDKAMKEAALREQQEKERMLAEEKAKAALAAAKAEAEDIHFDFDKYDLKPEARSILKKLGDSLMADKAATVLIEGNCDERGTVEYNLALGEKRALSAKKYLASLGVDKKRIKTISYGKERPLDPGHNEQAWAKNRRDHFVVTVK